MHLCCHVQAARASRRIVAASGRRLQSWVLLCEQRMWRAAGALALAEQYYSTDSGGGKPMRLYDSASRSSLLCEAWEDCMQMNGRELAEEQHLQMQHNERTRDRVIP